MPTDEIKVLCPTCSAPVASVRSGQTIYIQHRQDGAHSLAVQWTAEVMWAEAQRELREALR